VDTKKEIRDFLTSRRGRITPEQAGLRSYGSRRVPGLRREEVAVLAGVSVPYYTRLERGDMSGVSQSVLEALARALELDDAERAHLFDLARAAQPAIAQPRRRRAPQRVRPEVQWTLDAITGAAAFVGNARLDILAANELGRALFSELYAAPLRPVNNARFVFLDARAETFYGDWERVAGECVAILRWAAGRDPHDRDLSDLVGELATQSETFRTRWAAHDVRFHNTGVKQFHHPVVGELSLTYNRMDLPADHGLTIFTYAAEPGSRSEEGSSSSAVGRPPPFLLTRKLHKQLHTHRMIDVEQVDLNGSGALAKPSDGLEPSTPSLPSRHERLPKAVHGCDPLRLDGYQGACVRRTSRAIASALLHRCSMSDGRACGERQSGPATGRDESSPGSLLLRFGRGRDERRELCLVVMAWPTIVLRFREEARWCQAG
jgi:transcriptional regulator with XRE-family HTH domain